MRLTVFIFLLCFFSTQSISQTHINDNCKEAYINVIGFKHTAARANLEIEKQINPDNPYIPYLNNYMDFLTVFIGEDRDVMDRMDNKKQERIKKIEALDDNDPIKKYMLGNMYLQFAVARIKFHENVTAAMEMNKAYHLLDRNDEQFPDFIPNKISLGGLHIGIGLIPDQYNWALRIVDLHGTVEQGTGELYEVLEASKTSEYQYLRSEALFYLGMVELNLNPDKKKAQRLLDELRKNTDQGLLLDYMEVKMLMRGGKNDEALEKFKYAETQEHDYPVHYLNYLHAECLLRRLDTDEALDYYLKFLTHFKGRNYVKDAWRKMAWVGALSEDSVAYFSYLETASKSGHTDMDADKEAEREIERASLPNTDLLLARVLFDGGYYIKAELALMQMNINHISPIELVERNYRLGRIYDKRGKTDEAVKYYRLALDQGADFKRYFAANAALKLGQLFEKHGDYEQATYYYEACLDLNFDEYRNSIRGKAKAGRNRID